LIPVKNNKIRLGLEDDLFVDFYCLGFLLFME